MKYKIDIVLYVLSAIIDIWVVILLRIGEIVRQFRENNGLSLREFADMAKLSHAYIDKLESGIDPRTQKPVTPTIRTIELLAAAMGLTTERLMEKAGIIDDKNEDKSSQHEEDPELEILFRDLREMDANDRAIIMAIARERKRQREQSDRGKESRKEDN